MTEIVLEDLGMSTTDYLAHHGILGQKWGKQQGPPYPLDPGDHSAAEKKAGWRQSLEENRDKVKAKVSQMREKAAARKEAREEKAAEKYEAKKKKIIESGDLEKVAKIQKDLSRNEIEQAILIADTNAKLASRTAKKTPGELYDDAVSKLNTAITRTQNTIGVYNKIANTMNLFMETEMPVLDKSYADRKEAKEKKAMDKLKENLLKSENDALVFENRNLFSTNELRDYSQRKDLVDEISNRESKKAKERADAAEQDRLDKIVRSGNRDLIEANMGKFSQKDLSAAISNAKMYEENHTKLLSRNQDAYNDNNVFKAQRSGDWADAVIEDRARTAMRNFYDQAVTEDRAREAEKKYFSAAWAENERFDAAKKANGANLFDNYYENIYADQYDDD